MILQLRGVHPVLGVVGGVLVEVGHEDGLAVGGLDVFSRAAVAVTAGADFLSRWLLAFNIFLSDCRGRGRAAVEKTYKVE